MRLVRITPRTLISEPPSLYVTDMENCKVLTLDFANAHGIEIISGTGGDLLLSLEDSDISFLVLMLDERMGLDEFAEDSNFGKGYPTRLYK